MNNKKLLRYASMMVIFVSIAFYIEIIKTSTVSGDSGHHLYYANLIHMENITPIKDFVCEYSPLGYYFFSWFWSVFGHTYSVAVALMMVCGLWITLWTGLIAKQLIGDQLAFWLASAIALPIWIVFQGGHPFLEPFVMVFLLPATYVYLFNEISRKQLLRVGFLLGLSLLGKQWALFFIIMFAIDLIFRAPQSRLKNIVFLMSPIGIPFILFALLNGVPLWDGIMHMATYGHQEYPMTFPPFSMIVAEYAQMYVAVIPMFIATCFSIFKWDSSYRLLTLCASIGFIVALFQPAHHYLMYTIPWAIILLCRMLFLLAQSVHRMPASSKRVALVIILLLLLIPCTRIPFYLKRYQEKSNLFNTFYGGLNLSNRKFQMSKHQLITDWSHGRSIVLHGDMPLQGIAGIKLFNNRAIYGSLTFPFNKHIYDNYIIGKTDIVTVKKRPDRTGVDQLISYLKENGYQITQQKTLQGEVISYLRHSSS